MTTFERHYGGSGAPLEIPGAPSDVLRPWLNHRARFRGFLAGLDDDAWQGATRCTEWNVLDIVHHLTSVTQFFGATVHKAGKGEATRYLETFDPKTTPLAITAMMTAGPDESLQAFEDADRSLAAQLESLDDDGWLQMAEAPPGHMPVRLSISHALFDSWTHERDVMIPMGLEPPAEADEVEVVGRYVLALAGGAAAGVLTGEQGAATADVIVSDPGMRFGIDATESAVRITVGEAPEGAPALRGRAADVLDLLTGREPMKPVETDPGAGAILERFASILR